MLYCLPLHISYFTPDIYIDPIVLYPGNGDLFLWFNEHEGMLLTNLAEMHSYIDMDNDGSYYASNRLVISPCNPLLYYNSM